MAPLLPPKQLTLVKVLVAVSGAAGWLTLAPIDTEQLLASVTVTV
jgi:hypothetical protein